MPQCIFCNIAQGKVDALKIYEDNAAVAFLDVNPSSPGHTLVIPKDHAATIFELPAASWYALLDTVRIVAERVQKVMKAEGLNIGWNHAAAAGQVVDHLHVHIIPRWKDDGGGSIQSLVHRKTSRELREIAAILQFSK